MRTKLLFVLAVFLTAVPIPDAHAMRWYSPSTGRWLSRDPIGDEAFVRNYLRQKYRMEIENVMYYLDDVSFPKAEVLEMIAEYQALETQSRGSGYAFCANGPVGRTDSFGLYSLGDLWADLGKVKKLWQKITLTKAVCDCAEWAKAYGEGDKSCDQEFDASVKADGDVIGQVKIWEKYKGSFSTWKGKCVGRYLNEKFGEKKAEELWDACGKLVIQPLKAAL